MYLKRIFDNFFCWGPAKRYFINAISSLIVGLILGLILAIIYPEALYDFLSFYHSLKEVNSVPLIQVLVPCDFLTKFSFLLKTNVLYECIVGIFLLGILNLAYVVLLFKYTLLGILVAMILIGGHYLVVILMLFIVMIEGIAFSVAAVAGDNIGRIWIRSKELCRTNTLIDTIKMSSFMLIIAILILISSSLIELGISYYLMTI